jgi:hypothetical protein
VSRLDRLEITRVTDAVGRWRDAGVEGEDVTGVEAAAELGFGRVQLQVTDERRDLVRFRRRTMKKPPAEAT